ncbi:hypothetical protein QO034_03770 [Sedimentitalea sp. JM2-8]|uniref:Uncharacterized protein n=1 Tax=Sedimentitalea xiamensis TaxID=3050037 RepID=A0ABT7FAS5_9RHOB|nr:hypothetical protein [Sedimentitalea xiamensis]
MISRCFVAGLALVLGAGVVAQTAPEADPDYQATCEVRGVNGMVTLVYCPEELSAESFRQEGIIACDGRLPCGAWFWTDPDLVPAEAPDSHDKLEPASIAGSHGVWMNEANQFFEIDAEKQ